MPIRGTQADRETVTFGPTGDLYLLRRLYRCTDVATRDRIKFNMYLQKSESNPSFIFWIRVIFTRNNISYVILAE